MILTFLSLTLTSLITCQNQDFYRLLDNCLDNMQTAQQLKKFSFPNFGNFLFKLFMIDQL